MPDVALTTSPLLVNDPLASPGTSAVKDACEQVTYKLHSSTLTVRRYVNESGVDVFGEWLAGVNDRQARARSAVVLLLCGGDKRTQRTDIAKAVANLHDFKRRSQ